MENTKNLPLTPNHESSKNPTPKEKLELFLTQRGMQNAQNYLERFGVEETDSPGGFHLISVSVEAKGSDGQLHKTKTIFEWKPNPEYNGHYDLTVKTATDNQEEDWLYFEDTQLIIDNQRRCLRFCFQKTPQNTSGEQTPLSRIISSGSVELNLEPKVDEEKKLASGRFFIHQL